MRRMLFVLVSLSASPALLVAMQGGGGGPGGPGDRADLLRADWRTVDGDRNNRQHPEWGRAGEPMIRFAPNDYADGSSAPAGATRPSARAVSNLVVAQPSDLPNTRGLSDLFWQWGQFLDHDLDETPVADPPVPHDIEVPLGDPIFDPLGTGVALIPLDRSHQEVVGGVAEQINELTSFLDASNVYGSDPARAAALRTLDGTGRLATSAGDLLPFNVAGLPNAPTSLAPNFFLAGDVRANEQLGLTAMHTVWVREHNQWAALLRLVAPQGHRSQSGGHGQQRPHGNRPLLERDHWDGETIYQIARALVVAEMQAITYREFLPLLLGQNALPPYRGYRNDVNPGIRNEFATVAYRFGHTMLPSSLLLLDANGAPASGGSISLVDSFFAPDTFSAIGVAPLIHGLVRQRAQELDPYIVDDVRNFLFSEHGTDGFDLASLNLQRGRDHGVPGLNDLRQALGMSPHAHFGTWSSDPSVRANLAAAYGNVGRVDAWIGGLAEDAAPGAVVGPTFHAVLRRQFRALRDGDRFWYERYLPDSLRHLVEAQTLAVVLRRNTGLGTAIPDQPLLVN